MKRRGRRYTPTRSSLGLLGSRESARQDEICPAGRLPHGRKKALALGVLRSLAGTLEPNLLALLDACITSKKARLL